MGDIIYLDHAAATPLDDRVLAAMQPYFSTQFYNPSSPYAPAVQVRREYEAAKEILAQAIGGKGNDITITAGATESINLIFAACKGHVVTSSIEHHAVLEASKLHEHTLVAPNEKGMVSAESVKKAITPTTEIVSIQLANNELGTIQPLRDIAEVVRAERARRAEAGDPRPIYFHSDASQGLGQIDVHVSRLGVDALTINAGKLYGPKQVAALWTDRFVRLTPLVYGGGQEKGIRSGTENVAGVIGFAKAIQLAVEHTNGEAKRLIVLRDYLQRELIARFPNAVVSGAGKKRLAGHLHISFPGLDAERLLFALETQGVLVATGSACAANKGSRSHVLTAIGMTPEVADGSLRITLGRLSTNENIQAAAAILVRVISAEMERVGK